MVILQQNHMYGGIDFLDFGHLIKKCETSEGVLSRTPSKAGGQEGPDDYTGVAAASSAFADSMVDHGRSHFWVFNNVGKDIRNPDGSINWAAFFIRFPALVAHMRYSAGYRPNLFLKTAWRLSVLTCGLLNNDQDSWILTWLLIHAAGDRGTVNKFITRTWVRKLRKRFPGGISEVFRNYFGFNHPISRYAQDFVARDLT
jgi:hypothetical protein